MVRYPEFVDTKTYLGMDSSLSHNEQLWAMLNNLTRVHLLTADKFNNFDSLIREYLVLGCNVFGLETGIVSEVSNEGNYIVRDVLSPLDVLEKGQQFPLEDTYCREVVKSQCVLGFPEVGKLDYMNCHPVYQNLKLEAYLSAPIFVENKVYGTLNFTSTTPRPHGFSQHERELITLMANAIGNYIMLRDKEAKLVDLNKRIKRFVGYVAHDLRNPIGSIIALAKMGDKPNTSESRLRNIIQRIIPTAETALEFVNSVLENAALSSGKLQLTQTPNLVDQLLQSAVQRLSGLADESESLVEVNCPADLTVHCDFNRIQQALVNLISNAIKYSPPQSVIQISATRSELSVEINIVNTVDDDDNEHHSSANSEIYGSTGFGLDIAKEIISAHNSELTLNNTKHTYSASFRLTI